jgi:uncharacterized membrane protein YidH (DUF202 family)
MQYLGIPLIVFGMLLCAYGVFDFMKQEGITADGMIFTADGVIHILIGIFVMLTGFILFFRGG